MTGVKRLDKACNTVSRNELIYTLYDRQLGFLGHMLQGTYSPHARNYTRYTSQLTAVQDVVVLELTTWTTSRN